MQSKHIASLKDNKIEQVKSFQICALSYIKAVEKEKEMLANLDSKAN